MNADLTLALSLADAADAITKRHFQTTGLTVRTKSDRTPVSAADEEVERMIRQRLESERPGDGIVGEEFGSSGSHIRRWVIDPIDGTKNYIRGVPVFATLIALDVNGRSEIGLISAPALGKRWWASRDEGAFCNGRRLKVSDVETLDAAFVGYDSITDFDAANLTPQFERLVRGCSRTRGFGDFWTHMLVAEGAIDVALETAVAHWDMAAVQVIVEEAGGRFTTLNGEQRADGGSGVSTNGLLHDVVLETMR